jgi:NitT/TauT family transport system ATP-binding protein
MQHVSQVFYSSRTDQSIPTLVDFSLEMQLGEFISVVGPSGCGKSTLLNIVSGLLRPTSGTVRIDGQLVTGVHPNIGYMPSRDALLPWRTAIKNVEYGLELKGVPERLEIAEKALASVGLVGFGHHYAGELSQGMRQRVAIARTFASSPEIMLLDEPFSALDAQTRLRMQQLFLEMWERERKTVLLVTHDVSEAISLSDRVVVLSTRPARILASIPVDFARPRDLRSLYRNPAFQDLLIRVWDMLDPAVEKAATR